MHLRQKYRPLSVVSGDKVYGVQWDRAVSERRFSPRTLKMKLQAQTAVLFGLSYKTAVWATTLILVLSLSRKSHFLTASEKNNNRSKLLKRSIIEHKLSFSHMHVCLLVSIAADSQAWRLTSSSVTGYTKFYEETSQWQTDRQTTTDACTSCTCRFQQRITVN